MKTSTFTTAFVAFLASAVTAVPVAANEADNLKARASDLENRSTDIGIYFCKAWGWGAPCYYQRYQYAVCYNAPDDYQGQISAFGPDQYQGTCNVYPGKNCQTASKPAGVLNIGYPGYASLSGGVADWNDHVNSWICYP